MNLRVQGTIVNSKCIFDTKDSNVFSELSKLGLIIKNTPLRSFRICRKCSAVITRLLRDTEAFKRWKNEETTERCQGGDASSTDKRDRDPTPSKTPRAVKKSRKSSEMPLRNSVTEVVIKYDFEKKTLTCQSDIAGIVENLAKRNFTRAAKLISKHIELMDHLQASVLDVVEADCVTLCNQHNQFMLWRSSAQDLQTFSFMELHADLKRLTPFLFSIISKITKDSLPHICAAASIALRGRQPHLSALSYYINSVLLYGGAKKAVFQRLAKMGISTTHSNAVGKQKEMAQYYILPLRSLKGDLESFLNQQSTDEQDRIIQRSLEELSLSETTDQQSKEGDVVDVFTFSTLSDQDMADLGVTPLPASALTTSSPPPTYSLIFDNLDFFIQTHHQSTSQTNKSLHWINHMCVINRVTSLHLDKLKPANSLIEYDLGNSLPGPNTQASMRREFVVLGSRILTTYLDSFKTLSCVVVHHIPHQFSEEMAQPSTHYPLGLLFKDETKTADLVDVLQHLQKEYVPRCLDGLERVLISGDRLTEGSCRNIQLAFADGETEEDRLEGLVFKFEDWHAIRNLFEIYHQIFFNEASAKDHGTILANMNLLRSPPLKMIFANHEFGVDV